MGPTATIKLSALQHNLQRAAELAPHSRLYAVIKANAYGHGLLRAASSLEAADALAVARVEEAVLLREAGIQKPLLVLEGFFNVEELEAASFHQLEVAIQQPEQLQILRQNPIKKPIQCWLKIDTGMHRLGFQPDAVDAAWQFLSTHESVAKGVRVMTHLASADDLADPVSQHQLKLFHSLTQKFSTATSVANSAGIIGWPEARSDWVRPGIMLYGASPMQGRTGEQDGLLPVMTLKSRIIAINSFTKGSAIGYSGTWTCPEDMRVGVVAAGYGDGYPRHAPAGTPLLVRGKRLPLIGRVSMDMLNIDLRGLPDAQVGDEVVLWGDGLAAEEIAQRAGTIAYELFCGVTQRVVFKEIDG